MIQEIKLSTRITKPIIGIMPKNESIHVVKVGVLTSNEEKEVKIEEIKIDKTECLSILLEITKTRDT